MPIDTALQARGSRLRPGGFSTHLVQCGSGIAPPPHPGQHLLQPPSQRNLPGASTSAEALQQWRRAPVPPGTLAQPWIPSKCSPPAACHTLYFGPESNGDLALREHTFSRSYAMALSKQFFCRIRHPHPLHLIPLRDGAGRY